MSVLVVGVDVSQAHLDVAVCPSQEHTEYLGTLPNNSSGWEALARPSCATVSTAMGDRPGLSGAGTDGRL